MLNRHVAAVSLPLALFSAISIAQLPADRVPQQFRTASRALITENVDRARTVPTLGAVNTDVAVSKDLGEADGKTVMDHIQLILRRPAERQAAFDAEVESLHTPGSVNFHQWLTPETIGEEFSPAPSDIATIIAYLRGEGFTVNRTGKSGMYIDFTGTAAQVERSFHTAIHNVVTPAGETHYAAVVAAQIPEALTPAVVGFVSLSDIPAHKQIQKQVKPVVALPQSNVPQGNVPQGNGARPLDTQGGAYYMGPQDFYTIYNENALLTGGTNGSGQTVALLEQTDIKSTDVQTFRTTFGVTATMNLTINQGYTNGSFTCTDPGTTSDEDEAVLDAEWASSVAPSATVLFMACANGSTNGIFESAEAVVDFNLAPVMSLSYGAPETGNASFGAFVSDIWEQAAAQGQTAVVSAGDSGSAGAADQNKSIATHGIVSNVMGDSSYNVSAGGTDFQDEYNQLEGDTGAQLSTYWSSSNGTGLSSAKSYIPETVWNSSCASSILATYEGKTPSTLCDADSFVQVAGGGGGYSIVNTTRPSFQNGTVYGLPSTSTYSGRLMPDVSMFASSGFWSHALPYFQSDASSSISYAGGTSFVAPQLAAIFSLIVEKYGQRLGQPDYVLYSMGGVEYGTTSFTGGTTCNGSGTTSNTGTTSTAPASTCIFNDVVTSNNSQPCTAGTANCYSDVTTNPTYGILATGSTASTIAWPAGQGYDMATGLGSLNIGNLVNDWQTAANVGTGFAATVTLGSSSGSYTYGSPSAITYTATVSGTGAFPAGTVAFSGTSPISTIGSATLGTSSGCSSGGTCTISTTKSYTPSATLQAGSYTITGSFTNVSQNYATATGTTPLVVNQQTPTVTVSAVTTAAASATLTASVAYTGTGSAPTGTVSFVVGSNSSVNATCSGSSSPLTCTASYSTAGLVGGANTITATIATDTNYNTTSGTNTLTYNQTFSGIGVSGFASPAVLTESGTVTVSALDQNGNADTGFVSAVTLTSSDAYATLPSAYTFQTTDHGAHVFNVTLNTLGTQSITATSGSVSASQTGILVGDAIWVLSAVGTLDKLSRTGSLLTSGVGTSGTAASYGGTAFDGSGNVWSVTAAANSVLFRSKLGAGTTAVTGAGLSAPVSVAVDGAGYIWVANKNGNTVSEFTNAGVAQSSSSGYGSSYVSAEALNAPSGVAIDKTGGVWVTNKSGSTVTHIFGAAAPAVTPLSTATTNGTLGTKP
jgi:subtilase family serine protease